MLPAFELSALVFAANTGAQAGAVAASCVESDGCGPNKVRETLAENAGKLARGQLLTTFILFAAAVVSLNNGETRSLATIIQTLSPAGIQAAETMLTAIIGEVAARLPREPYIPAKGCECNDK